LTLHLQLTCRFYFVPFYRLGASSENETKATSAISAPPSASLFSPPYHSNKNNPFVSKFDPEEQPRDTDRFASDNNPFTTKWGQKSKQDTECFIAATSSASGNENKPFAPKREQESQIEDSSNSAKSPLPVPATSVLELEPSAFQLSDIDNPPVSKVGEDSGSFNSPPASFSTSSLAGNRDDSKHVHLVPSEKPQKEGLTKQIDPGNLIPGDLNVKPTTLSVIPEVGLDDEQLSDYPQGTEKKLQT
ncbi:uncharacterized protein LOC144327068, partial [Podarcis muralis]